MAMPITYRTRVFSLYLKRPLWPADEPAMRTWTFPIRRKRPVFMPAWARVFGWTALALSPIAILQREPLALAGTIVAGALLFLYGLSRPHDPNYMRTFPYEFVGDLEIRPDENPDSSTRLLRGGLLGVAYFLAANLVDSDLNSVLASLPLSAILAIWGYQITDKPPRWVIAAAATAAAL